MWRRKNDEFSSSRESRVNSGVPTARDVLGAFWRRLGGSHRVLLCAVFPAAAVPPWPNPIRHPEPSGICHLCAHGGSLYGGRFERRTPGRHAWTALSEQFARIRCRYDVVLGKLAVKSLDAFFLVLAIFPLLGLPLLLGGVSGLQFWHLTITLLNTLLFSLALGLLVSALGYTERATLVNALVFLLLFVLGLPLAWKGLTVFGNQRWFDYLFLFPSPSYSFQQIGAGPRLSDFWTSTLVVLGISTIFLLTASFVLPRHFQERSNASSVWEWAAYTLKYGRRAQREWKRLRWLKRGPIHWLVRRDRSFSIMLAVFTVLAIGLILWTLRLRSGSLFSGTLFATFVLHFLLKFLVAVESARQYNDDKRSGALELLLCTPVDTGLLRNVPRIRLHRLLLLPSLLLGIQGFCLGAALPFFSSDSWMFVLAGCTAWPDCRAAIRLGMLHGLEAKNLARAVFASLGWLLIPPWLVFFGFVAFGSSIRMSQEGVHLFFVCWCIGVVLFDQWLVSSIERTLHFCFRAVSANDRRTPFLDQFQHYPAPGSSAANIHLHRTPQSTGF